MLGRFALLLFSAYGHITQWLQKHMLPCPSKKLLHLECPGCGLQRSLIALLNADLSASWNLYPATVPVLLLSLFTLLHLKFRFAAGASIIKYSYAGIAILIVVFYIYKIINHKITA